MRSVIAVIAAALLSVCATAGHLAAGAEILMVTMGGTKSHKIPFMELAKGLISRGHRITFVNGFISDFHMDGLVEVTPMKLVDYIHNFTNWDLLGARYAGKEPLTVWQALRYPMESCNSLLSDDTIIELLTHKFELAIVDGAFPECALGLVHQLHNVNRNVGNGGSGAKGTVPFMFINTVGFYTGSLAIAGNPIAYAVTPHVFTTLTQTMNFLQRTQNFVYHATAELLHKVWTHQVHAVLKDHLDPHIPHPHALASNVSFILQNGHPSITYARPLYPNVAEIACIHCRPAATLPADLQEFMDAAPAGVIFFSMGSSVRASNMPEELRKLLVTVFARLPQYHILWKWEGNASQMADLTTNVRLSEWLPQQDILGHRKVKAFITHGGLLSMYEAIYHGVPMVMMPVFCDHDVNAAKADEDGYAIRLPLENLSADQLMRAINAIMFNEAYKKAIRYRRSLLLDHVVSPLDLAIFWTEYVLRHNGAHELQAYGRHMSFYLYYSVDVVLFLAIGFGITFFVILRSAIFIWKLVRLGKVKEE